MENVAQRQKTTIRAAFILSVIQWTCFALEITLLAYIAKSLGVDDVRIGYLNTVTAICQLITSPFFSHWAGNHLKFAVTVAFLSSATSFFLTAISNGFWLLFLSRVAAAFAHGAVTAQTAVAASTKPEERTAAFGKLGATVGIGFTVGSALGGASAGILGLRVPIFAGSILCAAAAFVGPLFIKVGPQSAEKKHDDEAPSQGVQGYLRLLKRNRVMAILSAKVLSLTPATIMLAIFGIYLINEFHVNPSANAMLSIYIGVCMTAMNGGGVSLLKKRLADRQLLFGGISSFALTGICLTLARGYYHFFAVMTLLAIGMALVGSSTDSMLTASVHDKDHALALSLAWALDALTRVIGPTLAGYMLTGYGFASFGYMQLLGAVGAAATVYLFL